MSACFFYILIFAWQVRLGGPANQERKANSVNKELQIVLVHRPRVWLAGSFPSHLKCNSVRPSECEPTWAYARCALRSYGCCVNPQRSWSTQVHGPHSCRWSSPWTSLTVQSLQREVFEWENKVKSKQQKYNLGAQLEHKCYCFTWH